MSYRALAMGLRRFAPRLDRRTPRQCLMQNKGRGVPAHKYGPEGEVKEGAADGMGSANRKGQNCFGVDGQAHICLLQATVLLMALCAWPNDLFPGGRCAS